MVPAQEPDIRSVGFQRRRPQSEPSVTKMGALQRASVRTCSRQSVLPAAGAREAAVMRLTFSASPPMRV